MSTGEHWIALLDMACAALNAANYALTRRPVSLGCAVFFGLLALTYVIAHT